jgi:hypothetical protein
MASKNRKQNRSKPPKRRKPAPPAAHDPDRLVRRAGRVKPLQREGEPPFDVAVFDGGVLAKLDPEAAAEVALVREALQLVADAYGNEANQRLATIPRRSPLSEWRLFIRGLVDWYDDRLEEAKECWKRLDESRRPSRIALALIASERSDLESGAEDLDGPLLSAARLVRQIRVDRPAWVEAKGVLSQRERVVGEGDNAILIGLERMNWVVEFCKEHRQLEPQLVEVVQRTALERASKQPFLDVFQVGAAKLPGPIHDPKHLLFQSLYHQHFEGGEARAQSFLEQYLTKCLPNNKNLSESLKGAIEAEAYLEQAIDEIDSDAGNPFARFFRKSTDSKQVIKLFGQAIAAYPGHDEAHRAYTDWLLQQANSDRAPKAKREPFEKLLLPAMEAWTSGVPEAIEPRLWLVDEYLENEQLESAQPHVQWLAGSRHADPRVRAIPWKWELLEAMRLCRRKTWMEAAGEKLDAAEKLWPAWLKKSFLPYLRAALLRRQGKAIEFEEARAEIRKSREAQGCTGSDLDDAVMMLAAAQLMRITAADLKPFRDPVDEAVEDLSKLSDDALVRLASFYWDLHRANLTYSAFRTHASKFAGELHDRLKRLRRGDFKATLNTSAFRDAALWISSRRLFGASQSFGIPPTMRPLLDSLAVDAMAVDSLFFGPKHLLFYASELAPEIQRLREAAATETDAYYRYWYGSLADRADAAIASNPLNSYGFDPFSMFNLDEDDDDDWEDDEDDLSLCDCEECRRNRAAAEARDDDAIMNRFLDDGPDNASDDYDTFQPVPPVIRIDPPVNPSAKPPVFPPLDPDYRRKRPKDPMNKKRKKSR